MINRCISLGFSICLLLSANQATAQGPTLVEVLPLTSEILLIHFDEGYVDHHDGGQAADEDQVFINPLDVNAASNIQTYVLTSTSDSAYAQPQVPTSINRKSKPTDFANYCDAWGPGCINNIRPDHTKDHYLYLNLPSPLQNSARYTLSFPGLTGQADVTWTHDDLSLRSEAVHVNLIGYVPTAPSKYGYVYHWLGDGGSIELGQEDRNFHLVDQSTGSIAFSGDVVFRKAANNQEFAYPSQSPPSGNLIGSAVWECDFSSFRENGAYKLCVDGVGCSFPFDIGEDLYKEVLDASVHGLYQQRSGIATVAPYTDQPRPAPHNPLVTSGFAGRLKYSAIPATAYGDLDNPATQQSQINGAVLGDLNAWGWYQDAGDWDGYITHAEVPMSLLWLTEMQWTKWSDGQLNLPENQNSLPDLLDEALWLPRFYQRLKAEMATKNYGTGGLGGSRVFGDINGEDYTSDEKLQGSWQDTDRDWIVSGEDPYMTYLYAGLAAHIATLFNKYDVPQVDTINWRQEAIDAFAWAEQQQTANTTEVYYPIEELRFFATANMYRLTQDLSLEAALTADFAAIEGNDLSKPTLYGLAAYRSAADEFTVDPSLLTLITDKIQADGQFVANTFRDERAMRWGGNWYVPLIVGQATTPLVHAAIVAHYFSPMDAPTRTVDYADALYTTADYFLGTNPLNQTWITGLGERSPNHVFVLDAWVIGGESPRKGVTPYGPWSKEFLTFFQYPGPYNPEWAFQYTYPEGEDAWPAHERWFDQRTAPLSAEYTVHQNISANVMTYGYLYGLTAQDAVSSVNNPGPASAKTQNLVFTPNPTSDRFRLDTSLKTKHYSSITLYSSSGQCIRKLDPNAESWSIVDLPKGMYQLRMVTTQGEALNGKLVKQ